MRTIIFSCIAVVSILNCDFHTRSSERESTVKNKTAINQDSIILTMTEILRSTINTHISLDVLTPSFTYSVEELGSKEITKCVSSGMNTDFIIAIEQKQEKGNYIRKFVVDGEIILFRDVALAESIAEYPFDVTGYIDCDEMRLYLLSEGNRSYLFVESTPMNWTGLMSAKFSFYQLIDTSKNLGIRTIAAIRK